MSVSVGIIVAIVVLLLASSAVLYALRRESPAPSPPPAAPPARTFDFAQRQALAETGTELLARRVDLDARRGTLGGDTALFDALDQLAGRHERGEISEAEFERQKIELLGG